MHHCKILIIDDNPAWQWQAVDAFPKDRYVIYTADSCHDGLKQFKIHKPDCVLLDYCLPDGDGAVFCCKVRKEEKLVRTPIIIVSGEGSWEKSAYTDCQADGFILKDADFAKNREVLEMVMRRICWERGIIDVGDIRLERAGLEVIRFSKSFVRLSFHQFQLFYLLVQESPDFVSEDEISKCLYNSDFAPQNEESIRGRIQRLRKKLGRQLGRRIKNKSGLGWIYVQPRLRDKVPCPAVQQVKSDISPKR